MLPVTGVILTLFIANTGLKYLAYKDSYLSIHKEHLDYKAGFLLEKRELVRYEDIKNQHSLKYRLTSVGTLHVGIGGSSIKQQENQNTASVPTINAFNATYIPSTHNVLDYVDAKIVGMKKGFNKTIQTAQRDIKNDVVLATLLAPPTLLLSLLALPLLIIRTKMYRYTIQRDRIVSEHGVWNKVKETVMTKNIDHLSKSQGFINNLASNGNVKIYTLGSQTADMVLANFKQYEEWKQKIEQKHRK